VLILSGDHLYRMDYMDFVQVITAYGLFFAVVCQSAWLNCSCHFDMQSHRQRDAGISICCLPIDDR
jgi:glucose-1-phosphate adenylyltransferase